MNVAAVIAEYNPFHNGHAYHIKETRRLTNADYILVIMSGDFVQRGEPACLDKYTRARMALQNGADLVLELPAAYASASAEAFAAGAVATLHRLGVVDTISYGSEYPREAVFSQLAQLYLHEPPAFSERLRNRLRQGDTYPQARAVATGEWLKAEGYADCPTGLLSSPNSILAIEYHKALLSLGSAIRPLAIRRLGEYHDAALPKAEEATFASATAIRRLLSEYDIMANTAIVQELCRQLPANVMEVLCQMPGFLTADDFSAALGYALLYTPADDFSHYADLSGELGRRIKKLIPQYQGWQSFTDLLKTRQLTRSRVSRALLHLLLRIQERQMQEWRLDGYAYYARVLGFHRSARRLLAAIKQNSSVLLLTKMAAAEQSLEFFYPNTPQRLSHARQLLETDLQAAHLYETMAALRFGRPPKNEYSHGLILLE